MTLRELASLFLLGLMVLSFLAGRDTCACGDVEEPEPIKISVPVL